MAGEETRLHWADYVVTVVCLIVALGIGLFFALCRGGQKTREEYLLGGRRMGVVPVCLSLFVTFQSAIRLLGTPSDTYNTGTMVFFISVGICLSYVLATFTIVPLLYPLRLTSVYHYLQLRFRSAGLKNLITVIGMLHTTVYMGIALYSPALVLQAVVGLSLWVSLVLISTICTIYTAIGGIRSVMWTDVLQTVIIFIGIMAGLIKGLLRVGGFSQMVNIADDGGRLVFDEVDVKARHSLWSTIIGMCSIWMFTHVSQSSVQRISSLPSLQHAIRCYLWNIPLHMLCGGTLCLMGVLLYAYFVTTGCDPYAAGFIHNKNQVAPYFMLHVLRDTPGMAGLYMSMLFSGALSTVSSGINALAANTVEDVLARPLRGMRDTTVTLIAKLTVVVYGLLSLGLAYLMKNLAGPVTQITTSVQGAFGSPVLGVFFLSAGFPRCNTYGATGGVVVGSAVSLTVALGSTLYGAPTPSLPPGPVDRCDVTNTSWTQPSVWNVTVVPLDLNATSDSPLHSRSDLSLWDISYLWFSVIGFSTTVLSGIVISLITGCKEEAGEVDPRLIFPCCRKLYGLAEPEDRTEDNAIPLDSVRESRLHKDNIETAPFVANRT
ncbi:sodium-coupled monocarboxylate transporter 1-like [Babylonia areolata]|uniref:sodium-coupled monocarboxylate transporter 1-like n=1 Tax=Babylonia areolata TaxID=304850 RepID=UPI003FD305C5